MLRTSTSSSSAQNWRNSERTNSMRRLSARRSRPATSLSRRDQSRTASSEEVCDLDRLLDLIGTGTGGLLLVFINACRSAGEVPEYTRLMGWASQFMAAGAGAFAGTLWAVRSATACAFAEAFYDALLAGQALGHAARTARKATAADAADPTWLAYAVYGDPEATATVATAPPAAPGTAGVASAGD